MTVVGVLVEAVVGHQHHARRRPRRAALRSATCTTPSVASACEPRASLCCGNAEQHHRRARRGRRARAPPCAGSPACAARRPASTRPARARRCPPSRTAGRRGRRRAARCSATSRRSAGVRRSRRIRCSGNDTPRWYRSALDRVGAGRAAVEQRARRARRWCADRLRRRRAARGSRPSPTSPGRSRSTTGAPSERADRVAEVRDRRRRRERDRVDLAGAHARDVGRRRARRHGAVHREHVDRVARAPRARRAARRGRSPRGRAAPARSAPRGSGNAVEQRLGDEPLGNEVGADAAPRRARRRCPGRSRRRARAPSARASSPAAREPAVEERIDAVGRREHDPLVAGRARAASKSIGSSAIDGSSITSAPSCSRRARSSLACSRARVTTTRRPNSGRCSNQPRSRPATSPTTIALGASTPSVGDRRERAADRALLGPRSPPHRGDRRGRARARRRSARCAMSARWPAPISTTSVPPARASAAQSVSVPALRRVLVAGHDGEARRQAAVRHRDARRTRARRSRS